MGDLLRTKSGAFTLATSHTLSEIGEYLESGRIGEILIPIDAMFPDIRRVTIKAGQEKSVYNGNPLRKGQLEICVLKTENRSGSTVRTERSLRYTFTAKAGRAMR